MPGTAAVTVLMGLTMYSGFLILRLVTAVSGCVLFSDIGEAAAGTKARTPAPGLSAEEAWRCSICSLGWEV